MVSIVNATTKRLRSKVLDFIVASCPARSVTLHSTDNNISVCVSWLYYIYKVSVALHPADSNISVCVLELCD